MQGDPDIVVIGSGPNGLVAACALAQRGFRVTVMEAHPRRPGGLLGTEELTLPGFAHDVGPSWLPLGNSPAFRALDLASTGLRWQHAPVASCHLAGDGSCAVLGRDIDGTTTHFGSEEDGATWRALVARHESRRVSLDELLLGPFPPLRPLLRLDARDWLHLARASLSSASALGRRWFATQAARQVFSGLARQAQDHAEGRRNGLLGYFLALKAASAGLPIPIGGARSVTNALVTLLERHGGHLRLGARVEEILVRGGRVAAVRTRDGTEIAVGRGVLADTPWSVLVLDLVDARHWPSRVLRRARAVQRSDGAGRHAVLQANWALAGPIPWSRGAATRSAVVHWAHLAIAQPSLFDATRAPPGQHTASCAAPLSLHAAPPGSASPEALAWQLEEQIEALAPGFGDRILARRVTQRSRRGLPGGSLPYFRYATSVRGLYLCSEDTHPGPGLHGMCGAHAARRAARELG